MPARPLTASLMLCLLLTACGTPQERCIAGNTRELRTVNGLIVETEGNLARGYALEEFVVTRTRWERCGRDFVVRNPDGSTSIRRDGRMCLEDYSTTERRPRAIDPADERRKLAGLQAQRTTLSRQAESVVAQCKALHPE